MAKIVQSSADRSTNWYVHLKSQYPCFPRQQRSTISSQDITIIQPTIYITSECLVPIRVSDLTDISPLVITSGHGLRRSAGRCGAPCATLFKMYSRKDSSDSRVDDGAGVVHRRGVECPVLRSTNGGGSS